LKISSALSVGNPTPVSQMETVSRPSESTSELIVNAPPLPFIFNPIQHQVHEDLLQLHPVSHDIGNIRFQFGLDYYGVASGFRLQQHTHFFDGALHVNHLAFTRSACLVERPQTVDNIMRIPLKWGTDSGELGQRRSGATLV
jgi:hypothetical protein